jgi:hypothetical protein
MAVTSAPSAWLVLQCLRQCSHRDLRILLGVSGRDIGFPKVVHTEEVDASNASTAIKDLERNSVGVLSISGQLHHSLDTFDDLPFDHSCKGDSRIEVDCCRP